MNTARIPVSPGMTGRSTRTIFWAKIFIAEVCLFSNQNIPMQVEWNFWETKLSLRIIWRRCRCVCLRTASWAIVYCNALASSSLSPGVVAGIAIQKKKYCCYCDPAWQNKDMQGQHLHKRNIAMTGISRVPPPAATTALMYSQLSKLHSVGQLLIW